MELDMLYDRTPVSGQTLTTTSAHGEAEPRLTLSQLQGLLREAAALERAQRPIVIHPTTQTAAAPHPGIEVRIPAPAAPVATTTADRERNPWPLVFIVSGCVGIGSAFVAAVTGSMTPGAVTLATFAVWGLATYRLVFGGGR
jgi:hypothetical protein